MENTLKNNLADDINDRPIGVVSDEEIKAKIISEFSSRMGSLICQSDVAPNTETILSSVAETLTMYAPGATVTLESPDMRIIREIMEETDNGIIHLTISVPCSWTIMRTVIVDSVIGPVPDSK